LSTDGLLKLFLYIIRDASSGHVINNGIADISLTAKRIKEKLTCSVTGGNSSVRQQWIELKADNKSHNKHELLICDTVSFQHWKQNASFTGTDLEFLCVATDGQHKWQTNITVSGSELNEVFRLCSDTPRTTGNWRVPQGTKIFQGMLLID
jgi:hypothetical protein